MGEHLTHQELEQYCLQRLETARLLAVTDHLGECDACRRRSEAALRSDAAFFALRAEVFDEAAAATISAHLTTEQTIDFVDSALTGEALQTVSDHLRRCEACALAVEDLQAFKEQVTPGLEHLYQPTMATPVISGATSGATSEAASVIAAPAAIASEAPAASQKTNGRQRLLASAAALFGRAPGLAFGTLAAVLVLALALWLLWRTPQADVPTPQIADTPAETPAPPLQPEIAPPSVPAPAAPIVAQLTDGGGQLTLDAEGKLSGAETLPPAYRNLLQQALAGRRLERSEQLQGLTRPPSSLMGADQETGGFAVMEPVGAVLLSDQPTFRWSPLPDASSYVVEVYDDAFNLLTASPQLTGQRWASAPLARGRVYAWQVKAVKDGQEFTAPRPPAPQARFRILSQAKASELTQARRAYPTSHLMLGLLYAQAGLLKEAEQHLRLVQRANPDSEIAGNLLRQVRAMRMKR